MAEQLSLFDRLRGVIGKPVPTQEQWLTGTVSPDFSRPIIQEEQPPAAPQPEPQEPTSHPIWDRITSAANDVSGLRQKKATKGRQALIDRLGGDGVKERAIRHITSSQQLQQSNQEKFKRLSRITDVKTGSRFITEGLGYELRNGQFRLPQQPLSDSEQMYYGAPYGAGASRKHLSGHYLQQFADNPDKLDALRNIKTPGDLRELQKGQVINNIPYALAEQLFHMFGSNERNGWNKWGKSGSKIGLNARNIEYDFDDDGNFLGTTNLDRAYDQLTSDEDRQTFELENFSGDFGDNRGIALLQKVLATAGVEATSGATDFLSPRNSTIDHGFPISGGGMAELPMNLLAAFGGPNQTKSGRDFGGYADQIESNLGGNFKIGGSDTKMQGAADVAPQLVDILKDRLFDPPSDKEEVDVKGIVDRLGMGEGIEDLIDMDYSTFNEIQKATGQAKERTTDALAKRSNLPSGILRTPPKVHGATEQPWAGNPNFSNGAQIGGDDSLQYLRKGLLLQSLFDPSQQEELEKARQAFVGARGNPTKQTVLQTAAYMDKIFSSRFGQPIKSRMASWVGGLTDHEDMLEQLQNYRGGVIDSLRGQIPTQAFDLMANRLEGEDESYGSLVRDWAEKKASQTGDDRYMERNGAMTEQDQQIMMSPYLEGDDEGSLIQNTAFNDTFSPLFHSRYGRDALRRNGHESMLDRFDRAPGSQIFTPRGDSAKLDTGLHSPYAQGDDIFKSLLGKLFFDSENQQFLENFTPDSRLL